MKSKAEVLYTNDASSYLHPGKGNSMGSLAIGSVLIGSFIACSVEVTEMAIIVVGVGTTRGWRSTLIGAGCGLFVLVVLIGGLGQALSLVPIDPLRVAIGSLLLTFGLQWLTKGVIGVAADGFRGAEEDESEVSNDQDSTGMIDWTAWLLSFKGVTLEGLEVAFIVIAFGAGSRGGQGGYLDAFVGAAAAFVIVGSAGALSINRLKQVPGRTLKFGVGGLISTFGTFWALEGLGVKWPNERLSLAWLYAAYLGLSFILMLVARRGLIGPAPYPSLVASPGAQGPIGIAPASGKSVQIFQMKRGLQPTGDVDNVTRAAMLAETKERRIEPSDWEPTRINPTDLDSITSFQERFKLPTTGVIDGRTRGALRVLQLPGMIDPCDGNEIRRFQTNHDLHATGQLDDETKAALKAVVTAATETEAQENAETAGPLLETHRWLHPEEPKSVRALQHVLHLEEDGVIGDETRGALQMLQFIEKMIQPDTKLTDNETVIDLTDSESVKEFQKDYSLKPDGEIGPKTRQALLWEKEHLLNTDVSSPESVRSFQSRHGLKTDGVVGPFTQAAMRSARMALQSSDAESRHRYGDAVSHAAGFGVGLDPADPESVKDFQRHHDLTADGIIGPRTQAALRALRAERRKVAS